MNVYTRFAAARWRDGETEKIVISDFKQQALAIVDAGKTLHQMGMVPATSGNFSARLNDASIAITVSGCHKSQLCVDDIMLMDSAGKVLDDKISSAEAGLATKCCFYWI